MRLAFLGLLRGLVFLQLHRLAATDEFVRLTAALVTYRNGQTAQATYQLIAFLHISSLLFRLPQALSGSQGTNTQTSNPAYQLAIVPPSEM